MADTMFKIGSLCLVIASFSCRVRSVQVEEYKPNVSRIVTGFSGMTEGPVFDKDGNLYIVEAILPAPNVQHGGGVDMIDLENRTFKRVCTPMNGSEPGVPVGLQMDRNGVLWIFDIRLGVLTMTPGGQCEQFTRFDSSGNLMQGCDDGAFDYEGNLWITAPSGQIPPQPFVTGLEERVNGTLYCLSARDKVMRYIDSGYHFNNGVTVIHDGRRPKTLIMAETLEKTIWAFDITGPCTVANKRVWAKTPGDHYGGPDGFEMDSQGNILVANVGSGYIEVFSPQGGSPITRIKLPFTMVLNLAFKPNSREVYLTQMEGTNSSLWMFEWKREGMTKYSRIDDELTTTPEQGMTTIAGCSSMGFSLALMCASLVHQTFSEFCV